MVEQGKQPMFLNIEKAQQMIDNSSDPFVRALLLCFKGTSTWQLDEKRPEGSFDMAYCFEILTAALNKSTLEKILQDPSAWLSPPREM